MNFYISIALLWEDYPELRNKANELISRIPWTHCQVREAAWHCTLFAIARLLHFRNPYSTPSEAMQSVLKDLPNDDIERILKAHLHSLRVRASEFRIYENSSSIQFAVEDKSSIIEMRKELSDALARFSLPLSTSVCVDFPMVDKKNEEDGLYGSFARRVEQLKDNPELHRELITPKLPSFEPKSLQVTVSDDALTNIRELDRDYFTVALRED